ncbi:Indole-3-glycerol phosphate synthase [Anaerohalosphaera lusitana]|uniref:Indole-3-glycerol phosphate synthase n=1 Tax=Anaerohalosphaera lusitana TaxID=1936003 RepID=A0A1U9NKA2_9BACT|nr:indole-3-glycerol phosphate synthase TrpC [Anaerohalosphaera lusitana]AQT68352.1 Indole-3-glycerol phosphate synthase [Anaerohalosphaera lusitana]
MSDILQEIVAYKREFVREQMQKVPLEQVKEQALAMGKSRNFYKAVTKRNRRGINVIAEVKKASPSAGLIREDFDPVEIARTYEKCGADAISVLTDEKYFQGKLEYLTRIKQEVKLPVLRKDFFVDEYQVYEAKAAGADAILLIAEALMPAQLMDLLILAAKLTMTAIIEVHSMDSLLQVRSLEGFPVAGYSVIGVNNRDLKTMTVDINTTGRLADLVEKKRELIAESGVKTREDVRKLKGIGVGAVLIGQTLCQSPSIEDKYKELFWIPGQ